MVVEVDVAKLQARVSRLYQEGTRHNQERIADISRRARSPGREFLLIRIFLIITALTAVVIV
jgi:hypothetical protein